MIKTLINHPGAGEFVAKHAGAVFTPGHDVVFCTARVADDGKEELLGGVIYTAFTGATCMCHIAGVDPHWITRDLLWVSCHYPFVQLGNHTIYSTVDSSNERALGFNRSFGFEEVARLERACLNGDMLIMALPRERCRFLNIKPRSLRVGGSHG